MIMKRRKKIDRSMMSRFEVGCKALDMLMEAQVLTEKCQLEYNKLRPHSSLGCNPPTTETILPRPSESQYGTYPKGQT